jgi:hypothetical protein
MPSAMCLECHRETSTMRRPWPTGGCCVMGGKNIVILTKKPLSFWRIPEICSLHLIKYIVSCFLNGLLYFINLFVVQFIA